MTASSGWRSIFTALAVAAGCAASAGPKPSNLGSSSRHVIYYGDTFDEATLDALDEYDVVILDPSNSPSLTPAWVARLQGRNKVKYVLGYITLGQDSVDYGTSPLVGDGTGPVSYDPVARTIVYHRRGIASFYVDQSWDAARRAYVQDGSADQNPIDWGGTNYFVWPNSAWRSLLDSQRIAGKNQPRGRAGLAQIVGPRTSATDTDRRNNFGFDGFFCDDLDIVAPFENVVGYYAWGAEEMRNTIKYIRDRYPSKIIMTNRGLFFFNPLIRNSHFNIRPFDYDIRPYISMMLFESYYLDPDASNPSHNPSSDDNKYNWSQKIIAEAARPDGFLVFSMGYDLGRDSTLLAADVRETIVRHGWPEYIAPDNMIHTVGNYVLNNPPPVDVEPPRWGNTGSEAYVPQGQTVPPRTGVQHVWSIPSSEGIAKVQWDIAFDQSGVVRYNVYRSADPTFPSGATTKYANVPFVTGDSWPTDPRTASANQYAVSGLPVGRHYFRVRAEDAAGREDANTASIGVDVVNVISNPVANGTMNVDGAFAEWTARTPFPDDSDEGQSSGDRLDWERARIAHDDTHFYFYYKNRGPSTLGAAYTVWVDSDSSRSSGYRGMRDDLPIGGDFMLQGPAVYRYSGAGTDWSWSPVANATYAVRDSEVELSLARSTLGSATKIDLVFYGDNTLYGGGTLIDLYPDKLTSPPGAGPYYSYAVAVTPSPPAGTPITIDGTFADWASVASLGMDPAEVADPTWLDWRQAWMAHDASKFHLSYLNDTQITFNWSYGAYLDTDENGSTGFRGAGNEFPLGAEYLLQGNFIYRYSGAGNDWSWVWVGTATSAASNNRVELSFDRAVVGNPAVVRLFFYGDNSAYPGGSGVDLFPDGALSSSSTVRSFVYSTR